MGELKPAGCTRTGECGCTKWSQHHLRMFCPDWREAERPAREENNWEAIPAAQREACLKVLRAWVPEDIIEHWRDQAKRDAQIGSEYLRFHMDQGMRIRNKLREVMADDQLPFVDYPEGGRHQNWDDFYMGALYELATED